MAIAIEDYEKALNAEVWPDRVAVRKFRPSRRDHEQRSTEALFGRTDGVVHGQPQQPQQVPQEQQQPQARKHQQPAPLSSEVIEVSNRYEALAERDDLENLKFS